EFDLRHDHLPLSAFPPAAQVYWNAYAAGTQIALSQLGVVPPAGWEIQAAFATRLPCEERYRPAPVPLRAAKRVASRARSGRLPAPRPSCSIPSQSPAIRRGRRPRSRTACGDRGRTSTPAGTRAAACRAPAAAPAALT